MTKSPMANPNMCCIGCFSSMPNLRVSRNSTKMTRPDKSVPVRRIESEFQLLIIRPVALTSQSSNSQGEETMAFSGNSTSRRSFVKTIVGSAAAATFAAPAIIRAADPTEKPETTTSTNSKEKLRLAFIGTGGIGGMHMDEFGKLGIAVPCYCDVDQTHWAEPKKRWPDAKSYQDYREMIDKEAKNFDAVVIGIPDHHHYPATILAMKAGKATYTQK